MIAQGLEVEFGHRAPRQSVCRNLKDLYGNILRFMFKSKYWLECSYINTKINVNLPHLLCFAVLAADNGEYRRFGGFVFGVYLRVINLQNADNSHCQPEGRQNTTDEVSLRSFWS